MLVLTVQNENVVKSIKSGGYFPNFWLSDFSCMTTHFTRAYRYLIDALGSKTCTHFLEEDSCMWGWVNNPFVLFHKFQKNWMKQVALFVDIPESELVFSDYDKFTDYVWGNRKACDFLIDRPLDGDKRCIQCVFSRINPENIIYEVNLRSLLEGRDLEVNYSVDELYIKGVLVEEFKRLREKVNNG